MNKTDSNYIDPFRDKTKLPEQENLKTKKVSDIEKKTSQVEKKIDKKSVEPQIKLKALSKEEEIASRLKQYVKIPEVLQDLNKEQQKQLFQACLKDYQAALDAYEATVAEICFTDPEAQKFAKDLCQRMSSLVTAYRKIEKLGDKDRTSGPVFISELKDKIIFARFFGNTAMGIGSVGYNPLVIQKAINEGNLREEMTLAYCTVFSFLLDEILKDNLTVAYINEQLEIDKAGFQIDADLIKKERAEQGRLIKPIEQVTKFRDTEKGRTKKEGRKVYEDFTGPKLKDIKGLSLNEARAALEDSVITKDELDHIQKGNLQTEREKELSERRVKWISGSRAWTIDEGSSYAKEVKALGLSPFSMVTGPSGTTDGFLHVAKYLGMGDRLSSGVKALTAWMVPGHDHSLHEILLIANEYGIPYEGKPGDVEKCFDEEMNVKVKSKLEEEGITLPGNCFTEEYQKQVAIRLGFESNLSLEFKEVAQQVQVPKELKSIKGDTKLQQFNYRLRQLEAEVIAIEKKLNDLFKTKPKDEYKKLSAELYDVKNSIVKEFDKEMLAKMKYVKKTYPDNPVYAMANPRILEKGTLVFTAGQPEKMTRLLEKGFVWIEENSATAFSDTFKAVGKWGENEMGEKGHYFSRDTAAYLSDELPSALECQLNESMDGVGILPIYELKTAKFTPEQIEKGYRQLQNEYAFLQNDGLPPKDTEIVFLYPEGKLRPVGINFNTGERYSLEGYYELIMGEETEVKLHESWDAKPEPVTSEEIIMKTGRNEEKEEDEISFDNGLEV